MPTKCLIRLFSFFLLTEELSHIWMLVSVGWRDSLGFLRMLQCCMPFSPDILHLEPSWWNRPYRPRPFTEEESKAQRLKDLLKVTQLVAGSANPLSVCALSTTCLKQWNFDACTIWPSDIDQTLNILTLLYAFYVSSWAILNFQCLALKALVKQVFHLWGCKTQMHPR